MMLVYAEVVRNIRSVVENNLEKTWHKIEELKKVILNLKED